MSIPSFRLLEICVFDNSMQYTPIFHTPMNLIVYSIQTLEVFNERRRLGATKLLGRMVSSWVRWKFFPCREIRKYCDLQKIWNFIHKIEFSVNFGRQKVFRTSTQPLESCNSDHRGDYFLLMCTNFKITHGIQQLLLGALHIVHVIKTNNFF